MVSRFLTYFLRYKRNTISSSLRNEEERKRRFHISIILFILLLLGLSTECFCQTGQGITVFSKKETLYSTKNGSAIGNILLTIEPKNATSNNNEWVLTIGDRGNNFFESRTERTVWIFNKKVTANDFRREMRNRDYPVEVKDISEFSIFCENGIRFELRDWEELRKQTQVSFFVTASTGQRVTIRLVFYVSSIDNRKRITIDDEAKVRIDFEIPDLSARAVQAQRNAQAQAQTQDGELISLTERIDPAVAAQLREAKKEEEEALLQAEGANLAQRMALLNSFMTERNREVIELQEEVNILLADKKTKVDAFKIDSLELVAEEIKKKVDFWENGYTEILLTEEAIHDKFTKLKLALTATTKKITELRQNQNPLNGIITYVQENLLMSLGGGAIGLFVLNFLMKFGKKMIAKIKSKIKSKINKMKSDAKNKAKQQPKKWLQKKKKKEKVFDEEYENIDINDLAEI